MTESEFLKYASSGNLIKAGSQEHGLMHFCTSHSSGIGSSDKNRIPVLKNWRRKQELIPRGLGELHDTINYYLK